MKKIIFTGGTSFSGLWFVKELCRKGYDIETLIFRKEGDYEGLRKERLSELKKISTPYFETSFGSEKHLQMMDAMPKIDLFCHHASDVTNYKSPDFDPVKALQMNTQNVKQVLEILSQKGTRHFILTGSVFEPQEGAGSDNLRAVSPYGLSKGLTSTLFEYYAPLYGISLKKFVIPNPFGPFEEVRFTTFLAQKWLKDEVCPVTQPRYIRDNIPVTLLARAYVNFIESDSLKTNPSYYPETMGSFVEKFALKMRPRLKKECRFELHPQKEFLEPKVRINTDLIQDHEWCEETFYDELAKFYTENYA